MGIAFRDEMCGVQWKGMSVDICLRGGQLFRRSHWGGHFGTTIFIVADLYWKTNAEKTHFVEIRDVHFC